jgi:hypothetical protein
MSNIAIQEAQAWAEKSKLDLGTALDGELEATVASQVISTIAQAYDVTSWITVATTPKLVRSVIAMMYVAWYYDRTYSEDADLSSYGALLRERADALIVAIVAGNVVLPELPTTDVGSPSFYPTDASSAQSPTCDDPSLGPEKFTMGVIW